jgi:peptidoglycan hydrolase CwlO-like protein
MAFCQQCGKTLDPGSVFCESCGAKNELAPPAPGPVNAYVPPPPPPPPPPPSPRHAPPPQTVQPYAAKPEVKQPQYPPAAKSASGSGKGMFLGIAAVLGVLAIALGVFAFMQTGKLGDARLSISSLETNVSNLETEVNGLQSQLTTEKGNVTKLTSDLNTEKANVTKLTGDLSAANANVTKLTSDLSTANANVTKLTSDLNAEKANVTKLTADLATANGKVTTLTADLSKANADLAKATADLATANASLTKANADLTAAKAANTTLTTDLNKLKSPKHFATLQELTTWLAKDDTNTNPLYATLRGPERTWVLQVKAARDGYIISSLVDYDAATRTTYYYNFAWVGSTVYGIDVLDDSVEVSSTLPFVPVPVPVTP